MKIVHPVAGTLALLTIATFWFSTALSELFGSHETVTFVKSAIPWGFLVLVPALAAVGLTGMRLGAKMRGPVIAAKKKRMPIIAATGILILMPAAFYLSAKAQAGAFDTSFYVVQVLELLAGASNLTLLSLNMRDGLRMKRRI